jgi:hypothetical protein
MIIVSSGYLFIIVVHFVSHKKNVQTFVMLVYTLFPIRRLIFFR